MSMESFDFGWRFKLAPTGTVNEFTALGAAFDDSAWEVLDVPHDMSIERPRSPDYLSGSAGGFFVDGRGWYRKTFEAPEAWRGRQVCLEFEGVYHNAEFWLNGRVVGEHPHGYTSFFVNLSEALLPGARNVLVVRLNTQQAPHSLWYAGGGIYRHVWLHVQAPVHLVPWGTAITTPTVTDDEALVNVAAEVANTLPVTGAVTLACRVLAPDGAVVMGTELAVAASAGTVTRAVLDLRVASPRRWSVDEPVLYRLETTLRDGTGTLDTQTLTFGIRTIRFSATEGFVLNETPLRLKGGCVHHDCGPLGAQTINRAEERKVELLKASGYNAVRCAHNPPSPAFLDACDRLGMLVIDEAFDVWQLEKMPFDYHLHFDDWCSRDLDSMLRRDRNHPSVVLWSIGNELIERGYPEAARIARRLADHVRAVEPTRPVTAGICDLWGAGPWSQLDGLFSALDVCGYNYELKEYESDHARFPERVIVATESFANQSFAYWKAVEKLPYVVGDFVWTAWDYLGESGIGRTSLNATPPGHMMGWPWHHANCGDLDICGGKRPQSYYRDVLWGVARAPYIAVHAPVPGDEEIKISSWGWLDLQPSWTWPGAEGKTLAVDVYFDCDELELRLNGRSLGRQPSGESATYVAHFKIPYEPGAIEAVAWHGGRIVATSRLRTAGDPVRLVLAPDRAPIRADRDDLSFVTVTAVDAEGIVVPWAAQLIYFTLRGPGTLAAVASADPCNTEPYRGNMHTLWRGRALAVVRPTGEPGAVTLEAHADGLTGAACQIGCEVSGH
ncbi:MAG: glycoside hydrolase family 2 TIM barrel-domain containing protein [bacterium]